MKKITASELKNLQLRLGNNDEGALKELYIVYGNKLFHFAYALVHSKELAEEVIEDVFIKIWQKRSRISVIENLAYYLFTITKNISTNYLRKYSHKRNIDLDSLSLPYYYINTSPEELFISNETLQRINAAINQLPPVCRVIFKLVKEDGLKYKDVAALLNLSIKTVENQMGIALKKLHVAVEIILPASIKSSSKKI